MDKATDAVVETSSSRETVKMDADLLARLRKVAQREGLVLGKLIDRVVHAGMKVEGIR